MSLPPRAKDLVVTVLLGVFASAAWDAIKALSGLRLPTSASRELFQVGYFVLIAGVGFFVGKRSSRRHARPSIFISSPGIALTLNYARRAAVTQLRIVSSQQVELVHVTVDLRGRALGGANFVYTCSDSDHHTLQPLTEFKKQMEKLFTELEIISFNQILVSLQGYAKFRVAGSPELMQVDINIPTVPLLANGPNAKAE